MSRRRPLEEIKMLMADGEWRTTAEICDALKLGQSTAVVHLNEMVRRGIVERGVKMRPTEIVDGGPKYKGRLIRQSIEKDGRGRPLPQRLTAYRWLVQ